MDIVSHGLWGAGAFGRKSKKDFWIAFFFGIMPDLFSFGIFTISTLLGFVDGPDWRSGPPDPSSIPSYVGGLYNITHSFIVFAFVFLIVWVIRKKPYYLMMGWPLHILFDIGTHSTSFFPTPFLWPLISYRFNGVPWSDPQILIPNFVFLALIYIGWWILKYKRRRKY